MTKKVILIVIDGAGYDAVLSECGFLESLVEAGQGRRWLMESCLPSLSAPLYATLHTGLAPIDHGLTSNEGLGPIMQPNVFSAARAAGRTTAAVAHSFFFDIFCGRAYDRLLDIETDDESLAIQHGRYYSMEHYNRANACQMAEIDLFAQAHTLVRKCAPDYLLVHSCSTDTIGHFHTSNSAQYRFQIWTVDNALARVLPLWRALGYEVLVTADHGMTTDGSHGGTGDLARRVAFYYFGDRKAAPDADSLLDQRIVAPTILSIMGVDGHALPKGDLFSG